MINDFFYIYAYSILLVCTMNMGVIGDTHLSKGPSDLKQNGTKMKLFPGTILDALSHGVVWSIL